MAKNMLMKTMWAMNIDGKNLKENKSLPTGNLST
jgi:hypothetical protein